MDVVAQQKFNTPKKPTWCPGCGDFSTWHALKGALVALGLEPHSVCIVYDIGCSGNMCSFINAYGFHGLHGRSIPTAAGIHLANPNIPVIVVGGDGGLFGEGLSHFVHATRANYNITVIAQNNQVYGLTTGQTSPTTMKGMETKSNPHGGYDEPIDPVSLAMLQGASYIAQGFSGDLEQVSDLIVKGVQHKGFSFVHVYQPCVTFNKVNTYEYFRERVYTLDQPFVDPLDGIRAIHNQDKKPLGVLYEDTSRVDYRENLEHVRGKTLIEGVGVKRDLTKVMSLYQ